MIGYTPISFNLEAPGDRRRFPFYARIRGLDFEVASLDKVYDIVYVTTCANISSWITYKLKNKSTKLIFEITDSYFLDNKLLWNFTRGIYRFLQGRESKLCLNYNNIYKRLFRIADAVVCSTLIQRDFILRYNPNVHISLDYFDEDIVCKKYNYDLNEVFNIVWEGQSHTVKNILILKNLLEKLDNIHLKIITDVEVPLFWRFKKKTENLFKGCKFSYEIIPWEISTFSKEISKADLAIIPINQKDKLSWNKPENKLILFWKIGIPVITSATPAYHKVFDRIKSDLTCSDDYEWMNKLNLFIKSEINVKEHMNTISMYLDAEHNKDTILNNWDKIFNSIFQSPEELASIKPLL